MAGPTDGLPRERLIPAMIAVCLAVGMATLDTAIVNTALPTLAVNLGTDAASVIWVVNTYQLVMVATILPFASLGEVLGHRRVYLAGLWVFVLASLVCGLAWSLPSLAIARVAQGLGAAALMSVNAALLRFIYPSRQLGKGMGINALVVGMSFALGPTVASAILSLASWHWLFLINVPLGLAAGWMASRNLPQFERSTHVYDRGAALLCAGLFGGLTLALTTGVQGVSPVATVLELLLALLCGAWLLRRQAGHPAPILAQDLYRRPLFALSSLTSVCSFSTQGLAFVALPFLLQHQLGHSQVATGYLITPWPAVVALMAMVAGRLADRYPPGLLGGLGLLALSAGMCSLALLQPGASALDIGWRMALCGAGFGFFQSPNLKALMTSAPTSRSGGASGVVAISRLVGQTLGASLVALCFHLSPGAGPQVALWLGCAFALVGAIASGLRLSGFARAI
ncbi:MFS transporter [Pseudomonas typographi]|uniref:MFS transporter n=1 Tax=Pseudomonas typographi TaxID=2715964 RepID=A0ABR7Z3J0_9PSED|nr:MFS transporter [Pseudomonas typographi]MBD1551980.1 MFS transporter [Pseudomonas typographi]MBD1586544.1 MFS transporter [Pseudomonas typographi]MBD1600045.1 MFS transporter [Pseudomonas typographi]